MAKKRKPGRKINAVMQQISRKKRIRKLVFFVVLIIVAFIFLTGSRGTYQLYKFSKQKHDLENEIKILNKEKSELQQMKSKIETDPDYIEKIAREKYKMKKKEEKVYEIVEE